MKKINLVLISVVLFTNIILSQTLIRGYVKDTDTEELIVGAVILESGMGVASTDSNGYFSFKLEPGTYQLTAKMLGYKTSAKEINLSNDDEELFLFYYLKSQPIEIEKVTVFGERFTEAQKYKTYELTTGDIKNIPVFIESDPIRAVQALPGVTQSHDLSDLVFLRGGNFDETLITLDEVPVYNPHHAGGVYSIFNTDVVQREILYPSNYPVKYGNALSGVLSLYSKDGNRDQLGGIGAIGLLSGKVFIEGPLGNGSFTLSGRRTYPDLIINTFADFPYYFYDFNGKYLLPLDGNNLISASFFYSKDVYRLYEGGFSARELEYKKEDLNWGNLIGRVSFTHLFEKGSLDITGYFSSSRSRSDVKTKRVEDQNGNVRESEHIFIDNYLRDISLKSNLALTLTGQSINIALQYNRISTNYYWDILDETLSSDINGDIQNVFFDFAPTLFSQAKNEDVITASLSDEIILTPSLTAILGYRMTYLSSISDYLHSPYLRFTYNLMDNLEFSLSYGKYHQYLFTNKDLIYSSTYAPFTPYFLPQNKNEVRSSDHYSAGFKWFGIFPDIDFEFEGYYKSRNNILSSDELTNTTALVTGYALGADLLLKKTEGFITGWLNYSFSRSIKEAKYKYYASYDRTHTLKALLNFNLSESWQFNAYWIYATGLPYTPAVGKYLSGLDYDPDSAEDGRYYGLYNFIWELYYGRKNTVRYSGYTRLDIGITGRFIWWGLIAKPYLQVLNVYRSMNAFDYDPRPDDTSVHDGSKRGSEIIPTIGVSIEF